MVHTIFVQGYIQFQDIKLTYAKKLKRRPYQDGFAGRACRDDNLSSTPGFHSQEVSSDFPPHVCWVICEELPANWKQQWNSLSYTDGACVGPCFQQCIMLLKWRHVPKDHWSNNGTRVKRGMLMRMPTQTHCSASRESTTWNQESSARRRRTRKESKFKLKCFNQNTNIIVL